MRGKCNEVIVNKKNFIPLVLFKPEGKKSTFDDNYYLSGLGYYDLDDTKVQFDLKEQEDYEIYGIMFFDKQTRFLIISEESHMPQWVPSDLFTIIDSRIPYDWSCNRFVSGKDEGIIVSYKELANSFDHLIGLISENPKDIDLFLKMKKNMEYLV